MTAPSPTSGRRDRNRLLRTRAFLGTALDIVATEGFDALTMQRLADECDSAIGAVYRYFPSKGALVAEVQREAIERLSTSYALIADRSARSFAKAGLEGTELALANLVVFGRFFIATADSFPQELRLLQMLMSEMRPVVPVEEGMRVIPSAMRLLDQARACVDAALAERALLPGPLSSMDRVIVWAAAVGGVLQLSHLDVYDLELFDGDRLARQTTLDLFVAWGAEPGMLAAAVARIDHLASKGPLAPPVPKEAS